MLNQQRLHLLGNQRQFHQQDNHNQWDSPLNQRRCLQMGNLHQWDSRSLWTNRSLLINHHKKEWLHHLEQLNHCRMKLPLFKQILTHLQPASIQNKHLAAQPSVSH